MVNVEIVQLDCRLDNPDTPDCVEVVHYRFSKSNYGFTAEIYGTKSLGEAGPANYTPFQNITESQVLQWCNFDMQAIESALDAQLVNMIAPSVLGQTPPWVTK